MKKLLLLLLLLVPVIAHCANTPLFTYSNISHQKDLNLKQENWELDQEFQNIYGQISLFANTQTANTFTAPQTFSTLIISNGVYGVFYTTVTQTVSGTGAWFPVNIMVATNTLNCSIDIVSSNGCVKVNQTGTYLVTAKAFINCSSGGTNGYVRVTRNSISTSMSTSAEIAGSLGVSANGNYASAAAYGAGPTSTFIVNLNAGDYLCLEFTGSNAPQDTLGYYSSAAWGNPPVLASLTILRVN